MKSSELDAHFFLEKSGVSMVEICISRIDLIEINFGIEINAHLTQIECFSGCFSFRLRMV